MHGSKAGIWGGGEPYVVAREAENSVAEEDDESLVTYVHDEMKELS